MSEKIKNEQEKDAEREKTQKEEKTQVPPVSGHKSVSSRPSVKKSVKSVEIPEGIDIKKDGSKIIVKGLKGELSRTFSHPNIRTGIKGNSVRFISVDERKKNRAIIGTFAAHVRNMINGVTYGWESKLKVVYSHFPIKIAVEGNEVMIQNFMGERNPRKSPIVGQTKVEVKKDDIVVTGIDKEEVGQTAANIELTTKVTGFDKRIFQDGCYITEKCKAVNDGN